RAPRDRASRPNAPVPANASSTIASRQASCSENRPPARISNTDSRARSLVGRVVPPSGASRTRWRCLPAMIRMRLLLHPRMFGFRLVTRVLVRARWPLRPRLGLMPLRLRLFLGGAGFGFLAKLLAHHTRRHFLDGAARQIAELEWAVGQADQPRHREAQMRHHLADLAIAPFAQRHGDPHIADALIAFVDRLDRAVGHAVDGDAFLQAREL